MVFKLENSTILIDGRKIFRAIILAHIVIKLHKAVYYATKKQCEVLDAELKRMKKEQKLSKKKQKAESK